MYIYFNAFLRALSSVSEADKRKLIRLALCLSALVNCSFTASSMAAEDIGSLYISTLLAFVSLLVLSFFNVNHQLLVHGLLGVTLVSGINMALHSGGIHSPALLWVVFTPNLALFFLSQWATLMWVLQVVLALVVVAYFTIENMSQIQDAAWTYSSSWTATHLIAAQLFLMLVHLIYDAQYRQKSKRISASIERMKEVKKHLQTTEAYKDRFISTVSADLRSPMNAILGYSDVLAEITKQQSSLTETVQHIQNSIRQLLDMTNNILDHAQLHEAKLKLIDRAVAIRPLIEAEWPLVGFKEGVAFEVQVDPTLPEWLWCDPQRLKQIVHILVTNAKKFTSSGKVCLHWRYEAQHLRVDVRDTGIGISEEVKAYIFKRFDKADEAINRQFGGIGLGLTNALELTKLFGGHMGFESEANKGSHFWVSLPIKAYDATSKPWVALDELAQLRHSRILVVDDQPVSLMVTMQILRKHLPQVQLRHASSGAQALEQLRSVPVDLVLMDVLMPQMDGPATCKMIRSVLSAPENQTPIIGLTASTHPKDRQRCFEAGMNHVIVKPVDPKHLLHVLSMAMQHLKSAPQNVAVDHRVIV